MLQVHSSLLSLVEEILFFEWDPAQVNSDLLLRGEYDILAPDLCRLLLRGADETAVFHHLQQLVKERGWQLREDEGRDRRVARRLAGLPFQQVPALEPATPRAEDNGGPAGLVQVGYKYLERRPGSHYKQPFIKGRKVRAEIIYRQTIGEEPRTPEELAEDYSIPVEAVREAIHYCVHNEPMLRKEREEELAKIYQHEKKHPPLRPPNAAPAS